MDDPLSSAHDVTVGYGARRSPSRSRMRENASGGAFLFLVVGGAMAYWVVTESWQGFATERWSQTQGVIKSMDVEHSSSRSGPQFSIHVTYAYAVNGKQYENTRISFPEKQYSGDKTFERQIGDNYRPGTRPTVYYNPADPNQACLTKGPSYLSTTIMGSMAAVFLVAGSICLVWSILDMKKAVMG
jgi:Protein of unknown function (DUF3592)